MTDIENFQHVKRYFRKKNKSKKSNIQLVAKFILTSIYVISMSINLIIFVIMIGRVGKSRNHEEEYGSLSHAFSRSLSSLLTFAQAQGINLFLKMVLYSLKKKGGSSGRKQKT